MTYSQVEGQSLKERLTFIKIFDSFVGTFGLPFERRIAMVKTDVTVENVNPTLLGYLEGLKKSGCC